MSKVIQSTDQSLLTDLTKSEYVLVDFWAPWCGPCKMVAPVLEAVAAKKENLTVAKVNVDDHNIAASKMGVRGIPTLALFKNGQHVATKVGAVSQDQLLSFLAQHGA